MALDVLADDVFVIPPETGAPVCPVCKGPLVVEINERNEHGLPHPRGIQTYCPKEEGNPDDHAVWTYDELLTAIGQVGRWCEREVMNKRNWELALWGESQIPDLEVV